METTHGSSYTRAQYQLVAKLKRVATSGDGLAEATSKVEIRAASRLGRLSWIETRIHPTPVVGKGVVWQVQHALYRNRIISD